MTCPSDTIASQKGCRGFSRIMPYGMLHRNGAPGEGEESNAHVYVSVFSTPNRRSSLRTS